MRKAIVTGATGFVGSNLCRYLLKNDWSLFLITRKSSDYALLTDIVNELKIFEYDGNLKDLMGYFRESKVDVVFHLASFFVAEHSSEQIDKLVESNIRFGLHLLEAMKYSNTKLLINTGTSWQHFNSQKYNPVDLYAATKQAFESLIKYYSEAEKLRVITLKLFDTYGESDTRKKIINQLNFYAEKGEVIDLSPGEQMIDLVHIDDVVIAYEKAYFYLENNKKVKNRDFGIASGRVVNLKKIIEIFENVSGKKILVNWGGRGYRKREVMKVWRNYKQLPNWKSDISIEEGLSRLNK